MDSWAVLLKRVNHFKKDLGNNAINPHAIANESEVEHGFGMTKLGSQGHLLTAEEFIQAKRSTRVEFLLKQCNMPIFTRN